MIITKKGLFASALALSGAFGTAWAEIIDCPNEPGRKCAQFDVVVRDFPSTHSDFENFTEEAFTSINYFNHVAWNHSQTCNAGDKDCVGGLDTWTTPGYQNDPNWMAKRADYANNGCGNTSNPELGLPIGMDGYPKVPNSSLPAYLQTKVSATGYAWYGEFQGCQPHPTLNPKGLKIMRGFAHELCASEANIAGWTKDTKDGDKKCDAAPVCKNHSWTQIVYVTPGMVQQQLTFDPSLGEDMMYEPIINKAREACDNQNFAEWFKGDAMRSNLPLELPAVEGATNLYEIDYNWNNGGYFPLDIVDAAGNYVGPREGTKQYGPQSLSIFCPPYSYAYASSQTDYLGNNTSGLCSAWLGAGGPKTPDAAVAAATAGGALGSLHLRNYSLTMMGYIKFKYKKDQGEIFEFAGDDDMWIYVDGVLAVDLGGTHLAAPGKVELDFLAQNAHGCHPGEPLASSCALDEAGSWTDGSWHHLHFFYADRQTDGSNMKIHSTLSEMAKSRYGAPAIGEATVTPKDGVWYTNLILSADLNEATVAGIMASISANPTAANAQNGSPVIVQRPRVDPATGNAIPGEFDTFVYALSSFEFGAENDDGFVYTITGSLFKVNPDGSIDPTPQQIQSGDAITFNYLQTDPSNEFYIKGVTDSPWMQANTIADKNGLTTANPDWGSVTIKASIGDNFDVVDKTITRPEFPVDRVAKDGEELSPEQTADLQVAILPAEAGSYPTGVDGWLAAKPTDPRCAGKSTNQECFGSTAVGGTDGVQTLNKTGNQAVCYNANGVESCPSISFWVDRPFKVNVRVFDHLGHFISQYTKSMSEAEMAAMVPKGSPTDGSCAGKPTFSGMLVSANIYPISQNGRKIATGPYIYQVALIKESWSVPADGTPAFCFTYAGNNAPMYEEAYERSSFSKKLGYRRK